MAQGVTSHDVTSHDVTSHDVTSRDVTSRDVTCVDIFWEIHNFWRRFFCSFFIFFKEFISFFRGVFFF